MNQRSLCDLNIPIGPECEAVARTTAELGYVFFALNTPILTQDLTSGKTGKKRKWEERSGGLLATTAAQLSKGQGQSNRIPKPPEFPWIADLKAKYNLLGIRQRLTLIYSNVHQLQTALANPNVRLYDIIAILPTSHDALLAALTNTSLIFDIISFDFEGPHWIQKLRLNRQKGELAAGKDIFFELTYSSALRGDDSLENLIYTAHSLLENVCVKRIKNLILTSGAGKGIEVKAPKDVASLGYLLGLDEGTTRISMRQAPARIIQKTEARKHGKAWAAFIPAIPRPESPGMESDDGGASPEQAEIIGGNAIY